MAINITQVNQVFNSMLSLLENDYLNIKNNISEAKNNCGTDTMAVYGVTMQDGFEDIEKAMLNEYNQVVSTIEEIKTVAKKVYEEQIAAEEAARKAQEAANSSSFTDGGGEGGGGGAAGGR